jgi:hypothetical protein
LDIVADVSKMTRMKRAKIMIAFMVMEAIGVEAPLSMPLDGTQDFSLGSKRQG